MSQYTYVHVLDKSLHFAIIQLFLAYICLGSANFAGSNVNDPASYKLAVNSLALYLVLGFFWLIVSAWILYHKYGRRGLIVGLAVNFVFYYLLWSMYATVIAQNPNTPSLERLNYYTGGDVLDGRVRPQDEAKLYERMGKINPNNAYAGSSYERMGKINPNNAYAGSSYERMGKVSGINPYDAHRTVERMGQVDDNLSSVGPVDGSVLPGSGNWLPFLHNGTSEIIDADVNPGAYNMSLNFPLETPNYPDPDFTTVTGGQQGPF